MARRPPSDKPVVMISSTARDLPKHREKVMHACLRQSCFPSMMEHLPANDADAIAASLEMVEEADIYLGVFAHRYGHVPAGHEISITEMEYERAMLQTRGLIGRQRELNLLTDWITRPEATGDARIFCVVAIGGMGKSALTWKWFQEIVPQEMSPLAGRMWWTFYESDATFENFVTRALAYVSGRSLDEVANCRFPIERRSCSRFSIVSPSSWLSTGWSGSWSPTLEWTRHISRIRISTTRP